MIFNALIFAGGKGSRMKNKSKAMTKLKGQPLIMYAINALIQSGVKNITIIRNINDDLILSLVERYKDQRVNIRFLDDSFQKGIHFSFMHFEKYLTFPLISLDCDIFFDTYDFSNMLKKASFLFETQSKIDAAIAISKMNPFQEPKQIIVNNEKIIDYVPYDCPQAYYGGFIFFWKQSPCDALAEYYRGDNSKRSFVSFFSKNHLIVPLIISYLWDIDTPERLSESERMIDIIDNQEADFSNLISNLKDEKSIKAIALGGSRSKNNYKIDSDYDIFCLVDDKDFSAFKDNFTEKLLSYSNIYLAAYVLYLENWGYLFKAMSKKHVCFDISILPCKRIDEMGVRSSNIVLYDPYGLYAEKIKKSNDNSFLTKHIEDNNQNNYSALFYFEWLRFEKSYKDNNYWLALKSVERMKKYYIHMSRIKNHDYSNNSHCPENNFYEKDYLIEIYKVDGTYLTLMNTAEHLKNIFVKQFNPLWA